jgi:hypothetical protein
MKFLALYTLDTIIFLRCPKLDTLISTTAYDMFSFIMLSKLSIIHAILVSAEASDILPVNSIEKPYHFVGSTSDNHVALWVPTDE